MIIQCEQCNTKFRLDDSKVTDKGVKVRCAKCKHVFTVAKEQQPESAPQADFSSMLEQSSGFAPEEQQTAGAQESSSFESSFDTTGLGGAFSPTATDEPEPFGALASEPASAPTEEFSFTSPEAEPGFAEQQQNAEVPGEVDFSNFDFGDASASPEPEVQIPDLGAAAPVQGTAPKPAQEDETSFDFGDDNLFGTAVAAPTVEEPSAPIKFDFQMDEFADSMGVQPTAGERGMPAEPKVDEPFSLGEIDFGDELSSVAVQQVNPDELKPGQDLLFAPLSDTTEKSVPAAPVAPATAPAPPSQVDEPQEDLPPLSISSRRKQSPMVMALAALLGLVIIGVIGFFGYSTFSDGKVKPAPEVERISVRSVNASYVKNKEIGELLVITGEAVNGYKAPRAALQVKGMVYNGAGKVLASKNAYAGNSLTKEQLATMPLDKIEAAMANQFGDSLSNLEVAPGKAVPFTIVIAKPAAEARDYGVEPAGSTVASGKQ